MTQFLIFGDSIAWGAWDREGGGWIQRLWKFLAEKNIADPNLHYRLYNLSISGDTTEWLLERFEAEAEERLGFREDGETTLFVFAIGINDTKFVPSQKSTLLSAEQFQKNVQALIKMAKKHVKPSKIIFVGLTPVDKKAEKYTTPLGYVYRNRYIKQFNEIIKSTCARNKAHFIDVFDKFKAKGYEKLLEDGLHPNAEGHKRIFELVRGYLAENEIVQ